MINIGINALGDKSGDYTFIADSKLVNKKNLEVIYFTFRPPPLNFSLNLVDLVILAFLDGDYFYK